MFLGGLQTFIAGLWLHKPVFFALLVASWGALFLVRFCGVIGYVVMGLSLPFILPVKVLGVLPQASLWLLPIWTGLLGLALPWHEINLLRRKVYSLFGLYIALIIGVGICGVGLYWYYPVINSWVMILGCAVLGLSSGFLLLSGAKKIQSHGPLTLVATSVAWLLTITMAMVYCVCTAGDLLIATCMVAGGITLFLYAAHILKVLSIETILGKVVVIATIIVCVDMVSMPLLCLLLGLIINILWPKSINSFAISEILPIVQGITFIIAATLFILVKEWLFIASVVLIVRMLVVLLSGYIAARVSGAYDMVRPAFGPSLLALDALPLLIVMHSQYTLIDPAYIPQLTSIALVVILGAMIVHYFVWPYVLRQAGEVPEQY